MAIPRPEKDETQTEQEDFAFEDNPKMEEKIDVGHRQVTPEQEAQDEFDDPAANDVPPESQAPRQPKTRNAPLD